MRSMAEHMTGDDMRLLSLAYIEAQLKEESTDAYFLERDARLMCRCLAGFACFLMDAVVIPAQNGVAWTDGWVEVDYRRRLDPEFRANLIRRRQYRRWATGLVLLPRFRLRRIARDCTDMLGLAHVVRFGSKRVLTQERAALEMVEYFRSRFCQTGDAHRNA